MSPPGDLLIRLIGRLVPGRDRERWLREWRAELAHLAREQARAGRSGWLTGILVRWHALDALQDAVGMRMRTLRGWSPIREIRQAVRALWRSPVFAGVTVVTLALGIGASTGIFSVLWEVVLKPLPYEEPGEVVYLAFSFRSDTGEKHFLAASEPEFLDLREELTGFRDLAAFWRSDMNLGGVEDPVRVPGAGVSANLLDLLGRSPVLGRDFAEGEDRPGAERVALVSHGLWTRALGSDTEAVGRSVLVNGRPTTIVGVLPPDFRFPVGRADLLVPNVIDPGDPAGRGSHYLEVVGRLAAGLGPEAGQARVDDLLERWQAAYERHDPGPGHPVDVVGLREWLVGDVSTALYLLMGAVGLVLLIACANVAGLMLVRAESRQREMGIRRALGAGRGDLARHVLLESLILSVLAGAGGLALAWVGVEWVARSQADLVPRLSGADPGGAVLAFTLALSLAAAVLFGLIPALGRGSGPPALLATAGRGGDDRGRLGFRRALVVAEIGTAVLLVVGAGVLLKSLARLQSVDPGFDPSGVVAMDFALNSASYPEPADVASFHEELGRRLKALPGVEAAGAIRVLPLRGEAVPIENVNLVGRVPSEDGPPWSTGYQVVSPGYFDALDVPVLRGRGLEPGDRPGARPVAVVNEAMADLFWPDSDPLGERIQLGWWEWEENENPVHTIVGVVGDVRGQDLARGGAPEMYVPRAQARDVYSGLGTRFSTLVIESGTEPAATIRAARAAIRELDPDLPVANVTTLETVVAASMANERLLGLLMAIFSGVALVLGAVGIYGLIAYTVSRRTRELGVRIALGADRSRVIRLVLGQAVALALVGVLLGVAGAWAGSRALESFLYEVNSRDPTVFTVGPLILLTVAVVAAWLPARRAARVDPVEAMRTE